MARLEPGTIVAWESQAMGSWRRKQGVVLAYLPAFADARRVLARLGATERLMAQPVSRYDRYLVRVQTGPRAVRIYAPRADVLESGGHDDKGLVGRGSGPVPRVRLGAGKDA